MSDKYLESLKSLLKAVDIAIESFKKCPPEYFNNIQIETCLNILKKTREQLENPQRKYATLSSLKISENDIFIFFNESNNKTSEFFWRRIKQESLPFIRKNIVKILKKIIKHNKIENFQEYEIIQDVVIPLFQENKISEKEKEKLFELVGTYEKNYL